MANEPKVRTRTRIRKGGAVVKTKTITKGDGMKRVERTKTRNNALGSMTTRSVSERGPMGKRGMAEYKGVSPEGAVYGFRLEKSKMGGRKSVMTKGYDEEGSSSMVKQKGPGYKTKTVKITDADGRSYVRKKGRGSRIAMKKVYKPTIKEQKI